MASKSWQNIAFSIEVSHAKCSSLLHGKAIRMDEEDKNIDSVRMGPIQTVIGGGELRHYCCMLDS